MRWLSTLIYQAAILETVGAFAVFIAFANGYDLSNKFGTAVTVTKLVSAVFGIYGCLILVEVSEKVNSYSLNQSSIEFDTKERLWFVEDGNVT